MPSPRLFISHSSRDKDLIYPLVERLRKFGIEVFFDEGLQAGEDWRSKLLSDLRASDGMIVLITENSILSEFVMSEIGSARALTTDRKFFIIPVLYENIEPPRVISDLFGIRLKNKNYDDVIAQIFVAIGFTPDVPNDPPPTPAINYWLLKMNPETWPPSQLPMKTKAWFNTHYFNDKRPEYDLFKNVAKGDLIIGYLAGDFKSVYFIFTVIEPVHLEPSIGESFSFEVTEFIEPPIPLANIREKFDILAHKLEITGGPPPELFFTLTETQYQTILRGETSIIGNSFANSSFPLINTEGDHVNTADKLDFKNDIDSFAYVICLKKVNPPLAIGLFGKWGSGKSFFMEKLRQKIKDISASKDVNCIENVVQVPFNSWHYSDSNLWASLITQIFDSLNRFSNEKGQVDEMKKLSETLEMTRVQKEAVEARKAELQQTVSMLEEKQARERERLEDVSGIKLVSMILGDQHVQKDLVQLNNKNTETIQANKEKLEQYQREVNETGNQLKHLWDLFKKIKGWRWAVVIIAVALIAAATYIIPKYFDVQWKAFTAWAASLTTLITGLFANGISALVPWKKNLKEANDRLESTIKTMEGRPQAVSPDLEKNVKELQQVTASLTVIDETLETTRKEINDIQSGRKLLEFIEARTRDESYSKQLGLISWIRKDFDKLDELLRKQHEVSLDKKAEIFNPNDVRLKIDRIILYIDDLDRCKEEIVVKVLEAIHLLLALPLFVVVVGVDPRWLNNALSEKYKSLFGAANPKETDIKKIESELFASGAATSYDYLEKIFQIPFTLKPIDKTGRDGLIAYLTENKPAEEKKEEASGNSSQQNAGTVSTTTAGQTNTGQTNTGEVSQGKTQDKEDDKKKIRQALVISKEEQEFMQNISPLFGQTPRGINRYVNIYRIIKSHSSLKVNGPYSEDEFMPIMLILAVVVGYSMFAQDFIQKLSTTDKATSFNKFIQNGKIAPELKTALLKNANSTASSLTLEPFQRNLELISRFSFRTLTQ